MKIVYFMLLIVGLTLTGCYTILEHPDISSKDENGFVYHDDVKFYDDCNSCHNSSDQAIVSSESYEQSNEPSMYRTYRNERSERSYHGDVYYSDSYYGSYGNYYNTPWWYQVSQSGSGKNNADAKEKYRTGSRENSGSSRNENEREVTRSSNQGGGLNYTSPTRSSNRSTDSNSGSNTSTEKTKSSTSSDSKSEERSNSDQPKSRNNDGNRSSGSGRR